MFWKSPGPLAPTPIAVFVFVQVTVVPYTLLMKPFVIGAPTQNVWLLTCTRTGVGLIAKSNPTGVPAQPFALGVTVKCALTWFVVVFTAVKAAMLPVPLAATPIEGVSFVHAYVVPLMLVVLEKLIAVEFEPLQITWLFTAFTSGRGFTTTVAVPEITFVHVPFVAETRVIVVLDVTPVAVITTVPPEPTVAVADVEPMLYVMISFAVPVIVNCAF